MIVISSQVVGWAMVILPILVFLVPAFLLWPSETLFCIAFFTFVALMLLSVATVIQGLHVLFPESVKDHPFWQ